MDKPYLVISLYCGEVITLKQARCFSDAVSLGAEMALVQSDPSVARRDVTFALADHSQWTHPTKEVLILIVDAEGNLYDEAEDAKTHRHTLKTALEDIITDDESYAMAHGDTSSLLRRIRKINTIANGALGAIR